MGIRKTAFVEGEYYHIFNRGVDKRQIFMDEKDSTRFLESVEFFNTEKPVGSFWHRKNRPSNKKKDVGSKAPHKQLVDVVAYCLNPNHYHMILGQKQESGISNFMQRLGTGYTNYFNEKYERNGSLFQGKFKAVHITSNEQLLHTSVYVNRNFEVHQKFTQKQRGVICSSWDEYIGDTEEALCSKDIVLGQFKSRRMYKTFADDAIQGIVERRRGIEEEEEASLEGIM